jgi:hypothetical protein
VLCLPSFVTLAKITRRADSESGLNNVAYLKLRVEQLDQMENTILLMIDEIYVARRVEYSGGQMYGMLPNGDTATTSLCFMVKSLAGSYCCNSPILQICSKCV